jgi:uncharacterized membrane protein YvbJ
MTNHFDIAQRKQKGVSTLTGIIIIIVSVFLFFGGAFTYEYFVIKDLEKTVNSNAKTQTTGFPN